MSGVAEPLYVRARATLLDALDALKPHLDTLVLVARRPSICTGIEPVDVGELSDIVIASLDVSRRAAGNRKPVVYSILEDSLGPLVDSERLRCLDALGPSLRSAMALMGENV